MNALMRQAKAPLDGLHRLIGSVTGKDRQALVPEIPPDAIAFLDPIDEICAEPPPLYARSVLYPIALLVLSLIAVGTLIQVDIVVTASGRLMTSMPPILIQPIERAIIREIKVRPGDQVHKGDVLAVLDPTFARADLGSLAAQRGSLAAQRDRLQAELDDRPFVGSASAGADEALQVTLYQQRQANYRSRLRVFTEEIAQLETSIKATEQDNQLLSSQLGVAHDVEEMYQSLLKSQNGSRLNYLNALSQRMRFDRDYQDSVSRLAELKHQVQSRRAEQQAFVDDWRRQILESLATAQTQLSVIEASVSKASFVNDLVVVTAPVDGVVLDMAQRSVGSIMHEAEPLFTIVPSGAKLVADINIASADVGSTKAGDPVLLKIDAFPYSRHGLVKGRLQYISEESSMGGPSMSSQQALQGAQAPQASIDAFHRGEVELTDISLRNMKEGAHLMPGMTLHAEIKTGTRSVVGFFLTPVTKGLGEAMREP